MWPFSASGLLKMKSERQPGARRDGFIRRPDFYIFCGSRKARYKKTRKKNTNVGLEFLCWQRPLLAENKRDSDYFFLRKRDLSFYLFAIAHNVYVQAV